MGLGSWGNLIDRSSVLPELAFLQEEDDGKLGGSLLKRTMCFIVSTHLGLKQGDCWPNDK